MKTPTLASPVLRTLGFLGVLAFPVFLRAAETQPAADSRISVRFIAPEKFTDVRDSWSGDSEAYRDGVLRDRRAFLQQRGEGVLREDLHLKIEVTDVDLAGDFEPWQFRSNQDIRIVKDIYPVRMKLVFQLTDSTGTVLAEGERMLSDFGRSKDLIPTSDPLRHEKAVLRDWLSREFRDFRKG
jgi:hypothetical protein